MKYATISPILSEQLALRDAMESSRLITPDAYAVTPKNPERFAGAFAAVLPYFRDVEWLVHQYAQDLDEALGPDRFRARWLKEEVAHGQTYDAMLAAAGLQTALPETGDVSTKFQILGKITRHSKTADAVLRLTVTTMGHLNESTNLIGQRAIIRKMTKIGEHELARTVGAMASQERNHDTYYRLEREVLLRMTTQAQQRAAEYIVTRTFTPVGANTPEMRRRFGAVVSFMTEDDQTGYSEEKFMEQVEALSFAVFDRDGKPRERVTKEQAMITSAFIACKDEFLADQR